MAETKSPAKKKRTEIIAHSRGMLTLYLSVLSDLTLLCASPLEPPKGPFTTAPAANSRFFQIVALYRLRQTLNNIPPPADC
ncbi:hypothetical protein TMatcc_001701 [Talaromyces marneffei ATCC 18224]|uniref:uncharacterized protein n=1 Tax=Talaromyces marneffei TaxID=37727 RepID=UPI0012AA1E0A|nr:uncharacterized protein EYB26_007095 [Talaromyces marneffei]KAE8551721.1 hypothetical protein EYB25_005611 [Talaromyces marneffei]QGA19406.1 hypothetical protein EYB26_007095 [Talaromyces marneffei]